MKHTFGEKIRELRIEKNLSQREVAKLSGVPFYTIVSLELNRSRVPLITTVIKLSIFFEISIDNLVKEVDFGI